MIVLDAAAAVDWLRDGADDAIDLPGLAAGRPIVVPSQWTLEVSGALLPAIADRRLAVSDLQGISQYIDMLDIRVEPAPAAGQIGGIAAFAAAHRVSARAASYLRLAMQNEAALVTLDPDMRRAAESLGVAVLPVSAR